MTPPFALPGKIVLGTVLFSVALAAASWGLSAAPIPDYGMPVQGPVQESAKAAAVVVGGAQLRLRATYSVHAYVMGVQHYRSDELAAIAPVDLALAWGQAVGRGVQSRLEIRQRDRWFYWHVAEGTAVPLPRPVFEASIANTHMIPANAAIALTLSQVRVGDSIQARGYLADIDGANPRMRRKTSLNRHDTGAGACEILYVTALEIDPPSVAAL